jgi:hypothetical protein
MSKELEELLRRARPVPPEASDEVVERARQAALAVTADLESESPRRARAPLESRRLLVAAVVLALALGAAFAAGFFVAPSSGTPPPRGAVKLQSIGPNYGVEISLPSGWTGRIYNEQRATEPPLAVMQFGNFALPANDDDVGTKAAQAMHAGNIFAVLLESRVNNSGFHSPLIEPPRVTSAAFLSMFEGVPPDHAFARVLFSTQSRRFMLWVQFGQKPAPAAQLEEVNRVLGSLHIEPR